MTFYKKSDSIAGIKGVVQMFLEFETQNEFKERYFEVLKYRLAYGSLELEGVTGALADAYQSMKIFNQLNAINYIFEQEPKEEMKFYEFANLLCGVVSKVSGEEVSEFRKTEAEVQGSNVKRSSPNMIRNDLAYLLDDYNYMVKQCKEPEDFYELEANFHIRLLRIHPFDDYNGRAARVLLTYNLCKNNLAPCIIAKEDKRKYCDLIEAGDVKGMSEFFKELSSKELDTMISLYKEMDAKGLIETNKMTYEEEKELEEVMKGSL